MIWSDRFSTWLCVKCEHERWWWWWWWIIYARIRGSPSAKPFKTLPRFALGVYIFHIISHLSDRATGGVHKIVCLHNIINSSREKAPKSQQIASQFFDMLHGKLHVCFGASLRSGWGHLFLQPKCFRSTWHELIFNLGHRIIWCMCV